MLRSKSVRRRMGQGVRERRLSFDGRKETKLTMYPGKIYENKKAEIVSEEEKSERRFFLEPTITIPAEAVAW